MNTTGYARRFVDHPLGFVAVLLVGIAVIYTGLVLYPPLGTVIWWAFPVVLCLTGAWELSRHGTNPLSAVAGALFVLGGISRALYRLVPMGELTGTVVNIIPLFGLFALMYAQHYRENE